MSSNMLQLYFGVGRFMPSEIQIQSAKLQKEQKKLNKADMQLVSNDKHSDWDHSDFEHVQTRITFSICTDVASW
jgi:hypothetical protein